jgi:hypothetical protein
MIVPTRHPLVESLSEFHLTAANGSPYGELHAGERILPLPRRRRPGTVLALGTVVAFAAGSGWMLSPGSGTRIDELSAESSSPPKRQESLKTAADAASMLKPPDTNTAASNTAAVVPPLKRSEPPPAGTPAVEKAAPVPAPLAETYVAPSPAVKAESESVPGDRRQGAGPRDPLRTRAEGIGLHPDLARGLLERLSQADYRNAETAIRRAIAEVPDDRVFKWPRQAKAGSAVFEVRFVSGAEPRCRRYVVTIAKDGWIGTALPMEKCGVRAPARRDESAGAHRGDAASLARAPVPR